MVDARRIFGNRGEQEAEAFLRKQGMIILDRQFRTRFGEIDLVAKDGDEVVFVEVKTRRTNQFGYPEESVTSAKLQKIIRAGEMYMQTRGWRETYRIDVVAIDASVEPHEILHIPAVH